MLALMQGHHTIYSQLVLIKQVFSITSTTPMKLQEKHSGVFFPHSNFGKMTMIIFEITTHPKGIWDENVWCSCLLVAFQVSLFNFVLTVCSVTIFFYLYFQRKERQTNPDGEPTAALLNSQSPFELWINHISNGHKYVQSWAFGNQQTQLHYRIGRRSSLDLLTLSRKPQALGFQSVVWPHVFLLV